MTSSRVSDCRNASGRLPCEERSPGRKVAKRVGAMAIEDQNAAPTGATTKEHLNRGVIGLPSAVVQSAAMVAPTAGIVATVAFIAGYAGLASPLTFAIGTVICLSIGIVVGEYARRIPTRRRVLLLSERNLRPGNGVRGRTRPGALVLHRLWLPGRVLLLVRTRTHRRRRLLGAVADLRGCAVLP